MTAPIISDPVERRSPQKQLFNRSLRSLLQHVVPAAARATMLFTGIVAGLGLARVSQAQIVVQSKPPYGLYLRGGSTFTNYRGQQEKYFGGTSSLNSYKDAAGYWYYILPNGDLYEYSPPYSNATLTGVRVAQLGTAYYNNPARLTYSLSQRNGTYYTNSRGQQEKYLGGTSSANGYSDPGGPWYHILPSGDLYEFTPPYSNPALTGVLAAKLGVAYYNWPSLLPYKLHQRDGSYFTNYRGQGEKYLGGLVSARGHNNPNGYWYYILPNGDLYEFTPPYSNAALAGVLLERLGSAYYNDPAPLLTNGVQIPSTAPLPAIKDWDAALFTQTGSINRDAYVRACTSLDASAIDQRLGPSATFYGNDRGKAPAVYSRYANGIYDWLTPGGGGQDWTGFGGQVAFLPDQSGVHGMALATFCWSYHENHGGRQFWHRYLLRAGIGLEDGGQWWSNTHDPVLDRPWFVEAMGGDPENTPVAIGRSRTGWANYSIVAFRNGVIAVSDTGNAGNAYPITKLPPGKVPTSAIVTNNHEFALLTVWDTNTLKGQVAIIALRGSLWMIPSGDWGRHGFFRGLRPLAFVDLPGSMRAPTSIAMSSDLVVDTVYDPAINVTNLADPAVRQRWLDAEPGPIRWGVGYPRRGYAVIGSRAENRIALLDLAPLYRWVRAEFLEKAPSGAAADNYWPGALPVSAYPTVVTTIPVPQPTFVTCGWPVEGGPAAWARRFVVGTMSGTVISFDAGALVSAKVGAAPPSVVGETYVGRNPCGISHGMHQLSWDRVYVACRGERSVVEVYVGEGAPYVLRELRDERFQDPVAIETSGTRDATIISVADFSGRQIVNYLTTPLHPWQDPICFGGLGADGTALWECTGVTKINGRPFILSSAEVP